VRIREIRDKCPKGDKDKAFEVRGRDVSSIITDQNLHKQLKKEKELVQTLDRGKGIGR
jgi:hypothetical protein